MKVNNHVLSVSVGNLEFDKPVPFLRSVFTVTKHENGTNCIVDGAFM